MKHVDVLGAAKYITHKSYDDNVDDLTPLKLQKLLYFVEGWTMGLKDDSLFFETPLAWKYGPVYREVYDLLKGRERVKKTDFAKVDDITDSPVKQMIDKVWKAYKDKTATELVYLSHQTTPWEKANQDPLSDVISKAEMRRYFRAIAHG